MRKYKPIELALQTAPMPYVLEQAECPQCLADGAAVVGRLGLRLVFRCEQCGVRFHRAARTDRQS